LIEEAKVSAAASAHSRVKQLMALNQEAVIKSMTANDISKMVDVLFKSTMSFQRMRNDGKVIKSAVTVEDWFDYLGTDMVKKVKSGILGAYIDGSSPTEVARNVILNSDPNSKANRAKVRALSFTMIHKANELANLQTFIDNEKYIDWIRYVSIDDARRDDVCEYADNDSVRLKLSPGEYAKQDMAVPSLHVFCRCYLSPQNK